MVILNFYFVVLVIFFTSLWSNSHCKWPRQDTNTFHRKSWRFTDVSTEDKPGKIGQKYEDIDNKKCKFSSSECETPLNEYGSIENEEEDPTKETVLQFPTEKQPIRLYNGTIFSDLAEKKLQNPMEFLPWSDTKLTSSEGHLISEFNKRILEVNEDSDSDELVEDSDKLNDTQARIIAYNVNMNTTGVSQVNRMTIGQLVGKSIFPDWIWTRFGMNRKIDVGATNLTRRPFYGNRLPALTFDNNLSRFLKLFTVVRFDNTPCVSPAGLNGTCYSSRECSELRGTSTSSCASGFGVCCVFQIGCGQTTSRNGSYFIGNANNISSGLSTCNIQIQRASALVNQIRLDFDVFTLQQPNAGSCEVDRFVVSGQNTNIPILCGENSGTHLYVEIEGQNAITLSIMTTGTGRGARRWTIRMTQYVTSSSSAPSHCLQYHTGLMGTIRSFNYVLQTSPQYLNNLNYAICIRKESGFCSVTFSNTGPDGTYTPFQIVNANENGQLIIPAGQAGVGIRDCPYDFILINGFRLCGERLNDATTNTLFVQDAPVTDTSNGPFIVNVRTNELDVGAGFSLYYRQNPCMSLGG